MSLLQVDIIRNRLGNGSPEFDKGVSVVGVITSTILDVSSVGIGSTEVISSDFQLKNITSLDPITLSTLETALEVTPNTFNSLYIGSGGISTFTGNAYISGITTVNNELYVDGNLIGGANINVTGIITAASFSGTLSGTASTTVNIPNLSGDVFSNNTVTTLATVNSNVGTFGGTNDIPVVTVNGKGLVTAVSTVSPNNGFLTLAVSGTGLSGFGSFAANQSGNSSFTVTSNATSNNTNSTIVARNSLGGFSAGVITATSVNVDYAEIENLNVSGVSTFQDKITLTNGLNVTDGNVGLGTTSSTSKLYVVGDVNVSGIVTATGGFISVGNTTPIQISLVGNQLTFTAVGIGSTTLTLS